MCRLLVLFLGHGGVVFRKLGRGFQLVLAHALQDGCQRELGHQQQEPHRKCPDHQHPLLWLVGVRLVLVAFFEVLGHDTHEGNLRQPEALYDRVALVQILSALVTKPRDVARQQKAVLAVDTARNEVELGNERVLEPIRKPLAAHNDPAHGQIVVVHFLVHPLRSVEHQHQKQKQGQFEALANVRGRNLEERRLVVLLEDGALDFSKVSANQQTQQGLVVRVHGNVQGGHVHKQQKGVEARVDKDQQNCNNHPRASWPPRGVPIQRIEAVLSKRAHQPIKDFYHGNQQIQLDHALVSNHVIHDADVNGF
mmetsp:Transcript_17617/g.43955  ORF Transcript_17617/g.43955 Transcript_17617/m.43955 type:complete len:309 (+) Transcript_17617:1410-2336(+)